MGNTGSYIYRNYANHYERVHTSIYGVSDS